MVATEPTAVVGVFTDHTLAEQTIDDLRQAGFNAERMGFIVRDTRLLPEVQADLEGKSETGTDAATGAVTGGVVGGLVGAAAAFLIPGLGPVLATGILIATLGGAVLGVATGTLIGVMVNLGVPEEEARTYEQAFQAGRAIVIVQADDRYQDAFRIMRYRQSLEGGELEGTEASTPPESYKTTALEATDAHISRS